MRDISTFIYYKLFTFADKPKKKMLNNYYLN
jgi:hypothetical protein